MSRYIPNRIRKLVIERAYGLCEYCLLHESQSFLGFEIDHIISLKHGGNNDTENLAYTCLYCNQNKGSDIGTILLPSDHFQRLYHPRKDRWNEHFEISGTLIITKTPIGEATEKILKFNDVDRLIERQIWLEMGLYPHPQTSNLFQ